MKNANRKTMKRIINWLMGRKVRPYPIAENENFLFDLEVYERKLSRMSFRRLVHESESDITTVYRYGISRVELVEMALKSKVLANA